MILSGTRTKFLFLPPLSFITSQIQELEASLAQPK